VLVAGFGSAVAADYAAFLSQGPAPNTVVVVDETTGRLVGPAVRSLSIDELSRSTADRRGDHDRINSVVLFLDAPIRGCERDSLDAVLEVARRCQPEFTGIISSFRLYLDDPAVQAVEDHVVSRTRDLPGRVVLFRPGHVLSEHSEISRFLRRFAPWYSLVPGRLRSCFIDGTAFFTAIEAQRLDVRGRTSPLAERAGAHGPAIRKPVGRLVGDKNRAFALLGPNRPWPEALSSHQAQGTRRSLTTACGMVLSWLLAGQVIAVVLGVLARRSPWWRQWNVHTLKPRSARELVSLCHGMNIGHVKVVGYNNGVHHFGHRHPGKTIVSTVRCGRLASAGELRLKADCGATVRSALDFLARRDRELYVVPNYSYVCLGTSFFVPIHGSAVEFSTVADTISGAVLYDPETDRIISTKRGDATFREHVYDQQSRIVVLRLYLLTRAKARYFVRRETVTNPSADEIVAALRDASAANVEIRQGHAASAKVTVSRYYTDVGDPSSPALELPRDALGRLWDRLEENPITSYLMHALSRHVAWHTELFMTPADFDRFWRTHHRLPLRKIQLRYLKRDGLPHSPFRDHDRVSADLFLFRVHQAKFLEHLDKTLEAVVTNPGKHSK
jgi:hypothetical protein